MTLCFALIKIFVADALCFLKSFQTLPFFWLTLWVTLWDFWTLNFFELYAFTLFSELKVSHNISFFKKETCFPAFIEAEKTCFRISIGFRLLHSFKLKWMNDVDFLWKEIWLIYVFFQQHLMDVLGHPHWQPTYMSFYSSYREQQLSYWRRPSNYLLYAIFRQSK